MSEHIPDLNLFMICKKVNISAFSELPGEFYFDTCKRNELDIWKSFPFDNETDAKKYNDYMTAFFNDVYSKKADLFFSKCIFVRNMLGEPIGTGFIWKAYDKINTLHWLKVKPAYENRGIGRAIISKILSELNTSDYPVYLHTQPGSYRAIKLYSDFGFEFMTDDIGGSRKNELKESLPILRKYMPETAYNSLKFTSAPADFLDVVSSSDINEF